MNKNECCFVIGAIMIYGTYPAGLENGELPWDGLKREVKEETGLDVEISKLAGVYSKPKVLLWGPPEQLDFKIWDSDFAQKMFELRPKNTAILIKI